MMIVNNMVNWWNAKSPHKTDSETLRVKIHTGLN